MDEERNSHVPLYCPNKGDIAHTIENSICQNIGNEAVCRDSTSLKILEEFRQIYEERLRKIDEDTDGDGMELKLKILTSWINDLGEQNIMLVQTVEQLEQEAADRVALLEERLKKSSHLALEYMSKLEDYDNRVLDVSEENPEPMFLQINTSARLAEAQQTEEILKTRISNLQNDISGLLELIRRARCDGSWDTDGLSFLEVTYEDIFGSHPQQISDKDDTIDDMHSTDGVLHQKLRESLEDYHGKEQEIKLLQEQVACQRADIALKDIQLKNFTEKTQELQIGELNELSKQENKAWSNLDENKCDSEIKPLPVSCPCLHFESNKVQILLDHSGQMCASSINAPDTTCTTFIDDSHTTSIKSDNIKEREKENITDCQMLKKPFHRSKINPLSFTSSKQVHYHKKIRERNRSKTVNDINIPKEQKKGIELCEVGSDLRRKLLVIGQPLPAPTSLLKDLRSAGDGMKTDASKMIKQNYGHVFQP